MNSKLGVASITIIVVSWLAFVVSFFLPAHDDLGQLILADRSLPTGWSSMVENCWYITVRPIVLVVEPRLVGFLVFPFVNAFVLVSPLLIYAAGEDCRPIAVPLLLFSVAIWLMPSNFHDGLLLGFYLWNLSPIGIAIGVLLRSKRLG